MTPYTYTINDKEIHLATVITPNRIAEFCSIFGKTKLSELIVPGDAAAKDTVSGMSRIVLDAIGDAKTSKRILNACTDREFTEEEAGNVDGVLIGQIATDFFLLLVVKLFARPK